MSRRPLLHALTFALLTAGCQSRTASPDIVLGEGMKPFSSTGWQPQVMAVTGQVSVLLREPDAAARIEAAKKRADADTRSLIEREDGSVDNRDQRSAISYQLSALKLKAEP